MLILTRRIGESIKIGDDIDVIALGIKGNQMRLGITAPRNIDVHREEIYNRILAEKLELAEPKLETYDASEIIEGTQNENSM